MHRKSIGLALSALLLSSTFIAVRPGISQVPGHSVAYGKSLGEWLQAWWKASLTGSSNYIGRVCLLPTPNGDLVEGDFSAENPATFVGHLDYTLKTGTPFVLPIAFWFGESYLPGTPVAENPDPPLPKWTFDNAHIKIQVDGKTIIDNTNKSQFYVAPAYYNPPLAYPEPTGYGSISTDFIQGYCFVHQPLSKGVHTIALESEAIIPPGVYANVPGGVGYRWRNTWTITVN